MKRLLLLLLIALAIISAVRIHAQEWANQPWAKARLDASSRHHEWVKIKQGSRDLQGFLVFPEVKDKATAVVVIHENRGLTDWARSVADQLAAAGYIAIAPDLLSGSAPNGGGTLDLKSADEAGRAIGELRSKQDQVTADLAAMVDYVAKLPACNGKVAVAGFCWGGSQTFQFATDNSKIKAAFVFYGSGPESPEAIAKIAVPVFGFYGGNDNRVNATIPKSEELMKAAGKKYEPVIYEGAGHGFMRSGDAPAPTSDADEKSRASYAANKKARDEGWKRWLAELKKL